MNAQAAGEAMTGIVGTGGLAWHPPLVFCSDAMSAPPGTEVFPTCRLECGKKHIETGCLSWLGVQGRKVKDVASQCKMVHFGRDGLTGIHEGQVDLPLARGSELA